MMTKEKQKTAIPDSAKHSCIASIDRSRFDMLTEMPPGELPARTGLQVALEQQGGRFFVELDDDKIAPRPVLRSMRRQARFVGLETCTRVAGHADVVLRCSATLLRM
jgi:hypothetical protein